MADNGRGVEIVGFMPGETNGKGTQIQAANGRFITFASLIQLPAGTPRVTVGVEVAAADRELTPDELTDAKLTGSPNGRHS